MNECSFFLATSALDLLFTTDGVANVGKGLEVDQTVDLVARREFTLDALLVFEHAFFQVPGHTRVERF